MSASPGPIERAARHRAHRQHDLVGDAPPAPTRRNDNAALDSVHLRSLSQALFLERRKLDLSFTAIRWVIVSAAFVASARPVDADLPAVPSMALMRLCCCGRCG